MGATKNLVGGKCWSGGEKIGNQNWSPLAKNGLRAGVVFTSIVEATGFSNRRHQHSVVSEREQQASDVLKKAYMCGREQQMNRLMHNSK